MSEIINLDNSFNNLDITNLDNDNDNENDSKLKKIIEEASQKAEWVSMDEDDINNFMDNFIEYSDDNGIEWEKFNYEVFDYNYYKSRFPKFTDDIIEILVKCSEKKIYNDVKTDNKIQPRKPLTEDDFIVTFD